MDYALHELDGDEQVTCGGLLDREESGRILVMPTHHVDEYGDLTGFRYQCSMHASGACLPISRKCFFGHTAVECGWQGRQILELMLEGDNNRRKMLEFLRDTHRDCSPGTLDCIPDNSDTLLHTSQRQYLHSSSDLRTVDCKSWTPEVPESIGLYHAYLRGFSRDVRTHKLFIVCSGGMDCASNVFSNLMIDVGSKWTCKEVAESEEVWWLRKASQRARCRLMYNLAQAFGIPVPHMQDIQSHDADTCIATHCTDTLEYDLSCNPQSGVVSVYSGCCDTTRPFNGIIARMHPGEGMWLFRGTPRGTSFGSLFGDSRTCGAFPTSQPRIIAPSNPGKKRVSAVSTVHSLPQSCVVSLGDKDTVAEPYMCFDEAYFKNLERMQWNRDHGYVELIPIVVGLGGTQ